MELINVNKNDDTLIIGLLGHVDSNNSEQIEKEINEARSGYEGKKIVIDADELKYISSSGLRILLRLRKEYPDLKLINVNSEVYEIFSITGFTEMMSIEKAYRKMSVDGCEVIGQGANGIVYRIDADTIVKVYRDPNALPEIRRERELARTALILGIPTAIPYDVVKVGDNYGSVFELLNAKSFAKLLVEDPTKLDDIVRMSVDLLKKIHSTVVENGDMPKMKDVAVGWVEFLEQYLPEDTYAKLYRMINEVPDDDHMLHGDYHLKNVMLQNDEVLLIDMDTLSVGHPLFEFAAIFNAYQGYSDLDHENIKGFLGIDYETGAKIWKEFLDLYFEGKSEEEKNEIADKARLVGFARNMRRIIRRNGFDTEKGRNEIENCKQHVIELTKKLDSLVF
ncbi:MAG: anti-sigma factor antagonist [Erysipelotrichaceae bacterium]|nr:anti-sigma factor antagonist [Erysipelotrichaceae bacterium]